jgi:hypothetical protein
VAGAVTRPRCPAGSRGDQRRGGARTCRRAHGGTARGQRRPGERQPHHGAEQAGERRTRRREEDVALDGRVRELPDLHGVEPEEHEQRDRQHRHDHRADPDGAKHPTVADERGHQPAQAGAQDDRPVVAEQEPRRGKAPLQRSELRRDGPQRQVRERHAHEQQADRVQART